MPFEQFDPRRLKLKPLEQRRHDLDRSILIYPSDQKEPFPDEALPELARRMRIAADKGRAVIVSAGAHVLRRGNAPLIIDLIKKGQITHLALNGAGAIHDFEFALIGQTCESVARYIRTGEFGLWQETGLINDAVKEGVADGLGFGEAVGRYIEVNRLPYRKESVLAAGYRFQVPVTVHVGFGQDIIHQHPNFDAAATGEATYRDFLIFTKSVTALEQGVFLNFGTAVMGPEVYLKALAMARNTEHQSGRRIRDITTAVFDLAPPPEEPTRELPKNTPRYYFRPFKTVLVRTVADGGRSYHICGDHRHTFPALYDLLISGEDQ